MQKFYFCCSLFVPIIVLLLSSCRPASGESVNANEFSRNFVPFNLENVKKLENIVTWQTTEAKSPISKIQYSISKNKLTIASDETGTITVIDVGTGSVISQIVLGLSNFHTFNITSDGSFLLGGVQYEEVLKKTTNRYEQIAVWNASTGLIEECVSEGCSTDTGDISEDEIYLGAIMDNAFENLVSFDEDTYLFSVYSNNELAYSGIALINSPDSDDWKKIGDIAIDSTNHRLAIIFQEGEIQLDTITSSDKTSLIPLKFSERLNRDDDNQPQEIQKSIFDVNGRWLAVVIGDNLAVWDVDGWGKKQLLAHEVGQIHGLSFDMEGALLFVGGKDQILIFGLRNKEIIAQLNTPNISTFCISEDNRLLFWGDDEGNIHVWAIKMTIQ